MLVLVAARLLGEDKHKAQYISLKEIRESNKDDSQAQIDGFYLCRMRLTIP